MNVFPQIPSLPALRPLRRAALALMFLLPAIVAAQEVPFTAPGIISVGGVPPIYNGKYVIQKTDFGFMWLDTTSLQPGLVQVEAKCGVGQPPSDTNIYVVGDCNGTTNVETGIAGGIDVVIAGQFSGQCGVATQGCNGGRVNGTGSFTFRLGTFEYLGQDLPGNLSPSTAKADLQGRTWSVISLDTTGRNFKWKPSGNPNAPPTAGATLTNVSAAGRADKANYYGDKWTLVDASAPAGSITRIDWDFNYNGTFIADETGAPATEGTVTGYFPCDPKGAVPGNIRLSTNCIQSLNLTNPPLTTSYRLALQSANVNGTSTTPFVSAPLQVACPQASILGYTGFTGTCAKTAGTLAVLTGGSADASASKGNIAEASVNWDFTGPNPISVSGAIVTVPAGATGFTLTITYPGGYQATATGNIVQASLVAAFSLVPNPVLLNSPLTLSNLMQKAAGTTLDSVNYVINSGSCDPAFNSFTAAQLAGSFLVANGTTTVAAPGTVGGYCAYLKYNFTPSGQAQQSQIVSNPFTATDWTALPQISISPVPFCLGGPCQLSTGTTYNLSDSETIPVSPRPPATWDLNGTSIGTSGDANVPFAWTPSSTCSNCTLRVTVNGASSTLPVTISNPQSPTPTPPPSPTPTPTPPPGGGISVSVQGPQSGSRGQTLTFSANATGGTGVYTYQWQCDYNPLGGFSTGSQTQTCSWSSSGNHNVKALVRDNAGSSNLSPDFFVSITGLPSPSSQSTLSGPTLTINQFNGRYSAATGSPVTFTATESDANAASFTWNFGDGTANGSGRVVTHSFATTKSYSVNLTVAGNETSTSGQSSSTINIDITGPPAPSTAHTVAGATATGSDTYEVEAQRQVTFTATETKATKWDWTFGDGTTATGQTATKAWNAAGSYTVGLTVTGNGSDTSGTNTASIAFNVTPVKFKAMIVPGAAHLDLGSSVWGTDVSVSNPGTDTLTITPSFVLFNDATADLDLSQIAYDPSLSFPLAPGASWSQVDVVKFLGGGSSKGTLVFKYEGVGDPVVTARVYFAAASDPQGASYGAAFPSYKVTGGGVSVQAEEQAVTTEQTLIGLRSNDLYRFRVTLYNADSKAGTFRLFAYDQANKQQFIKNEAGQYVGFREFRIGPYQKADPNDDDLGLKDASMRYVLKASRAPGTSTGTLIAFGTALDRKTSDLVQIADDTPSTVAESGVISYYVAGVSHLDTGRAQWRTDLRIFNKSSKDRQLGFEYYYTKGFGTPEQRAQVVNRTIPANGLLTFDDVVDSLMKQDTASDLSGDTAGMLRIFHFEDTESSSPLVISSRNYDDPSDGSGTAGTQLGVYSASQSIKSGGSALVIPGAEFSARFYSLVGLFALDNVPTNGRITAYDPSGKEVGHYDFALNQGGGGSGHFGQVRLSDMTDWVNPGQPVTVRVSVTSGGRVGGYAVTVDLKTNDLTFFQGRPLF